MTLHPELSAEDRKLAAYLIDVAPIPFPDVLGALNYALTSKLSLGESLVHLGKLHPEQIQAFIAASRTDDEQDDDGQEDPEARTPLPRGTTLADVRPPAGMLHQESEEPWTDIHERQTPAPLGVSGQLVSHVTDDLDPDEITIQPDGPIPPTISRFRKNLGRPPSSPGDWDGLGPTRPYEPGRISEEGNLLETSTLQPGESGESRDPMFEQRVQPQVVDPASRHATPAFGAGMDQLDDLQTAFHDAVHDQRKTSGVDVELRKASAFLSPSGKDTAERYQFRGEIGRGGMGRIIKAFDTEIGREVAIKVLLGGAQASENLIRRFWTEVQATGQLEHPSIIPIHDVGRLPSGELFYVMKMLSGQTLAEILNQLAAKDPETRREFNRVRLLTIFQQIAYAVAFSHAHGVIHRDIKPANIMVGRYGEAILLDWGLAKILSEGDDLEVSEDLPKVEMVGRYSAAETASGTITGTPQYMSPEATEGRPEMVNARSDVYGLGAVLYEILTLQPAFPDLGFVPTVVKVRQGQFVRPKERAPSANIPIELEELCVQAMSMQPQDRPQAKQLADDIGAILEGAKERERRVQEAKSRVRQGRKATERWRTLKVDLQAAESESKRLAKEVPPWAELEAKRAIWSVEDRVSELKIEAISAFEESEADFLRALGEVPDDREARSALASLYYARFGEAERARDVEGQRYYRSLVSRYDDGVWERVLEGDGTLEVFVNPPDVQVSIARMQERGRVLVPGEAKVLGQGHVERFEIPIGSYLLTLSRPNARDILRPVMVGRTEVVTAHLEFRAGRDLGDDFVLVPEGAAILGGDPIAHGGLERRVIEIGEYAISRFPVTCDEYLAFLNAVAREDIDRARRHVPRARAQEGFYWRFNEELGRFEYPPKSPGGHAWVGNLPVNGISMRDAQAYISWRASLTGERLRLPHENEWEKAARGVDGRFFPWGDHFDPTFCKMKESRNLPYPEPEPVGAFPIDCSPYGARDMAGSMREICVTEVGGRLVPVMRGGCWHDTGLFCRVAFRHVTQPDFVNTGLGFRLAKDLV